MSMPILFVSRAPLCVRGCQSDTEFRTGCPCCHMGSVGRSQITLFPSSCSSTLNTPLRMRQASTYSPYSSPASSALLLTMFWAPLTLLSLPFYTVALPSSPTPSQNVSLSAASSCYPALGFAKPVVLPPNNSNWWCDPGDEYAFVGFSYEVTACSSQPSIID